MTAAEYIGTVTGGRLPLEMAAKIAALVRSMDGKKLCFSISEVKRRRSGNQNRYYWGVVIPPIVQVFREAGNSVDAEDVHSYLKEHVGKLSQVLVTPDGEVLRSLGSTAKLSTMEMETYLEKVRCWAAETLGIEIGLPNETINN